MGNSVTTLIVEPRSLVREALVSLLARHSYRVVGGVATTADLDCSLPGADVPKIVILGALPAADATTAANYVRKLWPNSKVVLLFEHASPTDFQVMLTSEIDGCIPLSASPDTLIGNLQQILDGNFKILVRESASRSVTALPSAQLPTPPIMTNEEAPKGTFDGSSTIRVRHGLSEREEQILRDLLKGLSNKIIARKLDIAEATVKVHMKSVLRKIRVANRTQAAIWALENGYGAVDAHPALPRLEAILQPSEAPREAA